MNTVGWDKWPRWVKQVVGEKKGVEVKEHHGRYYAYSYRNVWDKEKKRPVKISRYLGVVKQTGIQSPHEVSLHGIYEYGHVKYPNS